MGKKAKTVKSDEETTPVQPQQQVVKEIEKKPESKPPTYVVVRDGFRVSDKEYSTQTDPEAIIERDFWNNVATKHSYKEKVEIVQYESKKHRIW
jgi:hypothetical protein